MMLWNGEIPSHTFMDEAYRSTCVRVVAGKLPFEAH